MRQGGSVRTRPEWLVAAGFVVAGFPLMELLQKSFFLIDRIVQFRKRIGDLSAVNIQFKPVGEIGILFGSPGERRNDNRIVGDKCRLDQLLFHHLVKNSHQDFSQRIIVVPLATSLAGKR